MNDQDKYGVCDWIFIRSKLASLTAWQPAYPSINQVWNSFVQNTIDAVRISEFPTYAFLAGRYYQIAAMYASADVVGNVQLGIDPPEKYTEEVLMKIQARLEEYTSGKARIPIPALLGSHKETYSMLTDSGEQYKILMNLQLVAAWTAFETLVSDLWEECLNARHWLSLVVLQKDSSSESESLKNKKKEKVAIPTYLLKNFGFDLSSKMGTILKTIWNFSGREAAISAYEAAFCDRCFKNKYRDEIMNILTNRSLVHLNAIRNNMVLRHSGCLKTVE